jgi:hypothetical protein
MQPIGICSSGGKYSKYFFCDVEFLQPREQNILQYFSSSHRIGSGLDISVKYYSINGKSKSIEESFFGRPKSNRIIAHS